jgi:DNA-binding response OmpR family regulator
MKNECILKGKRILIVDDEPDILDLLEGFLSSCDVMKASTFEEAKELLETEYFDMAILDIMGVDGYRLLKIANTKNVISIMLTSHALDPENIVRSFKEGAVSYVPKDKIAEITTFLNDILEAREEGKNPRHRWMERFLSFLDERFGPDWQSHDEEFWKNFPHYI